MGFLVSRLGSLCAAAVGGYPDSDGGIEGGLAKIPVVTLDPHKVLPVLLQAVCATLIAKGPAMGKQEKA